MAVDIKNLNHNQLNDLISKAQMRQDELRKEKVVKLREKIHALIKSEGYTFEDIFGATRKSKKPYAEPGRAVRVAGNGLIRSRSGPINRGVN